MFYLLRLSEEAGLILFIFRSSEKDFSYDKSNYRKQNKYQNEKVYFFLPANKKYQCVCHYRDDKRRPLQQVFCLSYENARSHAGESQYEDYCRDRFDNVKKGGKRYMRFVHDGNRHGKQNKIRQRIPCPERIFSLSRGLDGSDNHSDDEHSVRNELYRSDGILGMNHSGKQENACRDGNHKVIGRA